MGKICASGYVDNYMSTPHLDPHPQLEIQAFGLCSSISTSGHRRDHVYAISKRVWTQRRKDSADWCIITLEIHLQTKTGWPGVEQTSTLRSRGTWIQTVKNRCMPILQEWNHHHNIHRWLHYVCQELLTAKGGRSRMKEKWMSTFE